MPDELLPKVEKWLHREGYPLQMRVARKFRKKGFHVTESTYYEDIVTKKTREIDVVATAEVDPTDVNPDFRFRIAFVIECKQTANQPWILFTTGEHGLPDTGGLLYRPMTGFGHMLEYNLGFEKITANDFFRLPDRPAYGITSVNLKKEDNNAEGKAEGKKDNYDRAYTATAQVLQAAEAEVRRRDQVIDIAPTCEIVFPVIVMGGNLYESFLDENDAPVIQKIDSGLLVLNSLGIPSAINVLTYDALDRFVDQSWQMTQKMFVDGKSIVRDIALKLKKDHKRPSITVIDGNG